MLPLTYEESCCSTLQLTGGNVRSTSMSG